MLKRKLTAKGLKGVAGGKPRNYTMNQLLGEVGKYDERKRI